MILTPHMAGRTPESTAAIVDLVMANLAAHLEGRPVLTPVLVEASGPQVR